jgi:hypothetical protein
MANVKNQRFDEPVPYQVTELGALWIDGQLRECDTCGAINFASGYVWGMDMYCGEHEPEGFAEDFRRIAREWEEGDWPDYDCHWSTWPTATLIDGKLVLVCLT